jgi:hypothetical protein
VKVYLEFGLVEAFQLGRSISLTRLPVVVPFVPYSLMPLQPKFVWMEYVVYLTVYAAEPPAGGVKVKVVLLGAVPATVRAVAPSVSVYTPLLEEIVFPLRSVVDDDP